MLHAVQCTLAFRQFCCACLPTQREAEEHVPVEHKARPADRRALGATGVLPPNRARPLQQRQPALDARPKLEACNVQINLCLVTGADLAATAAAAATTTTLCEATVGVCRIQRTNRDRGIPRPCRLLLPAWALARPLSRAAAGSGIAVAPQPQRARGHEHANMRGSMHVSKHAYYGRTMVCV